MGYSAPICALSILCSDGFYRYSQGMDLGVSTDWSYHGLRAVVLENRLLRVVVLPEAGARIWQITHKPTDTDLLWNNPRVRPSRLPMNSRYDDVWSGGWDELFPNDEGTLIDGEAYPDHGELWTGQWQAEPFARGDEVGVHLRFVTPISAIAIEKTIALRRDSAQIAFHHVFRNVGTTPFPFMWKLHPALAVTEHHRIDFPAMKVILEPTSPGTLVGAPPSFDWPYLRRQDGSTVDLRRIPPPDARQMYFFYGTEMQAGWCALTNTATRLACALVFDPAIFSHCWLFASYGGWRSHNVAVLEPCTGYPVNFDAMRAAGRHRMLAPGQTLATDVLFVVQSGIDSVADVGRDGVLRPA
jgi:galactose mutarotase-like enzyme